MAISRNDFIRKLIAISYNRNDLSLERDNFRVQGDTVDIVTANMRDKAIRVEFFGDEIDRICEINIVTGEVLRLLNYAPIYPATHYAVSDEKKEKALNEIMLEMVERREYDRRTFQDAGIRQGSARPTVLSLELPVLRSPDALPLDA